MAQQLRVFGSALFRVKVRQLFGREPVTGVEPTVQFVEMTALDQQMVQQGDSMRVARVGKRPCAVQVQEP
jgi:hypothetical protein